MDLIVNLSPKHLFRYTADDGVFRLYFLGRILYDQPIDGPINISAVNPNAENIIVNVGSPLLPYRLYEILPDEFKLLGKFSSIEITDHGKTLKCTGSHKNITLTNQTPNNLKPQIKYGDNNVVLTHCAPRPAKPRNHKPMDFTNPNAPSVHTYSPFNRILCPDEYSPFNIKPEYVAHIWNISKKFRTSG